MTLAASLRGRHLAFALHCDGVDGHAITDTTHLAKLDAGDTVFVSELPFDMAKPLPTSPPAACELRVTDSGKLVGRYCIADGSTNPGACRRSRRAPHDRGATPRATCDTAARPQASAARHGSVRGGART